MRKTTLICCISLTLTMIMFSMAACQREIVDTPDVLTPAIMLDGVIYYSQGKVLEIAPSEESYAGYITSVVSEKYLPSRNGEANIQCLDSPYILLDKEAAVYFNEKWLLFEISDDANIDEISNLSDHRPMIYVNDSIYYETADVLLEIPSKAEIIGSILEKVSQNKPMVNENFYSNCLPVGSEIYYDKDAPDIIYAKIDSDGTTKYSVYEKAIDN